jgi:hypothetical protein
VVAEALRGRRAGVLGALAAVAAVAFLLTMVVSGRRPGTRNLVTFTAAGLMAETPDRVDRVELTADGGRWTLTRTGPAQWTVAPSMRPLAPAVAAHVEMSLRFMHVTAPVRVLSRDEYTPEGLEEFGLDPPRSTVSLHQGTRSLLTARFGGIGPQQVVQYVGVDGRDEIYLLPVFVGREWGQVARGAGAR